MWVRFNVTLPPTNLTLYLLQGMEQRYTVESLKRGQYGDRSFVQGGCPLGGFYNCIVTIDTSN